MSPVQWRSPGGHQTWPRTISRQAADNYSMISLQIIASAGSCKQRFSHARTRITLENVCWEWYPLNLCNNFTSLKITVSQKKRDYVFYNNLSNKCLITIMFGILSSQTMRHRKMVSIPTSPTSVESSSYYYLVQPNDHRSVFVEIIPLCDGRMDI